METFPSVTPSFGSKPKTEHRVLEAQFGDGYRQIAGDGLNAKQTTWELVFDNVSASEANSIKAFLDARKGYEPFLWTPPGGTEGKWTCTAYDGPTPTGYNIFNITATFRQEFVL